MPPKNRNVAHPVGSVQTAVGTAGTRTRARSRRGRQWAMGSKPESGGLDAQLFATLQEAGCLKDINPAATQTIIRQFLQNVGVGG